MTLLLEARFEVRDVGDSMVAGTSEKDLSNVGLSVNVQLIREHDRYNDIVETSTCNTYS